MFKKLSFLLLPLFALLLGACGSGSHSSASHGFSSTQKTFLYDLFKNEYLWSDQVAPDVDTSGFTNPEQMINTLRVSPDRWSFALSMQEYDTMANQKASGFGIGYTPGYEIFLVRIGAPAYGKLFRGDKIVLVNGESATAALITKASQKFNKPATLTVLRNSEMVDVTVTPKTYQYSVTENKIILHNNRKVGYLRYDGFTSNSVSELEEDFSAFKRAGVNELVIDLRYNGGGALSVASTLLDNIVSTHPGERQFYLDWNDNNKEKNSNYNFEEKSLQDGNELNMKRVFFLVTPNSASASEAVINALVPYLGKSNVITVGTKTHGKPVGMEGRVYGDEIYFLINFYVRNTAGETTSFSGISPTCAANDDITHRMGDTQEAMLSTALYYMDHGVCP